MTSKKGKRAENLPITSPEHHSQAPTSARISWHSLKIESNWRYCKLFSVLWATISHFRFLRAQSDTKESSKDQLLMKSSRKIQKPQLVENWGPQNRQLWSEVRRLTPTETWAQTVFVGEHDVIQQKLNINICWHFNAFNIQNKEGFLPHFFVWCHLLWCWI